ncbi:MAG: NTP transferase domain-containing protein [Saprospiraceae bacterium]
MQNAKKHEKHAKLTRPDSGNFGRMEWALLGAPCGRIQHIWQQLSRQLGDEYKIAYVDADHSSGEDQAATDPLHNSKAIYTDKIGYHQIQFRLDATPFTFRQWFNQQDVVLVNGNHFKARRQLLILDPAKFGSLQRKLDRLTAVDAILTTNPGQAIPEFIQAAVPGWEDLPVFDADATDALAGFLRDQIETAIPAVQGLVLAGGKSQRMGQDKGQLEYHGLPQREYVYRMLESAGLTAYLSCRPEQEPEMPEGYRLVTDSFSGLGPYGAILSAFRHDPNTAWLVIACDLPFVDPATIRFLLGNRDTSAVATAFHNPATGFADPLLTLWEPRAYPVLLQFLAQGYSCPRKVLINSATKLLEAPDIQVLTNVNNPKEFANAKSLLKS